MAIKHDLSTEEGRQAFYNSRPWRRLSSDIKAKCNYECQQCKDAGRVTSSKNGARLITHHIQELKDRPDLATDEANLTVLCQACHEQAHGRRGHPSNQSQRWNDEWF